MEKDFLDLYFNQGNLALEIGHNQIADWNIVIYDRKGKTLSECKTPDIHIQESDRKLAFAKAYAALTEYLSETRGGY